MKSHYLIVLLVMTGFAFAGLTGGSLNHSPKTTQKQSVSNAIPPEIFSIMEHSCLACHGTGGKAMALSHLKLSEWDGYSSEKQAQKAKAICKMISKGKMPPKGYLKANPDRALTKAQIDNLCEWSKSLNKSK